MNKMQALLENVAGTFGVSERICFGAIIDKSMNGGVKNISIYSVQEPSYTLYRATSKSPSA